MKALRSMVSVVALGLVSFAGPFGFRLFRSYFSAISCYEIGVHSRA